MLWAVRGRYSEHVTAFYLSSCARHPSLHSFPTRRSSDLQRRRQLGRADVNKLELRRIAAEAQVRSEEHTSELQSRLHLVCRLLLEKKNLARAWARRPHSSACCSSRSRSHRSARSERVLP